MPTWSEYQAQGERKARREAQNAVMRERHREFDLSAQDQHHKWERPSFVVVTSSEAYRDGWDRIFRSRA